MPARATFKRIETTTRPVEDVANYKLDAAVVEEVNYKHALDNHLVGANQVRVFYTSPGFPDNVWAGRPDLPEPIRARWVRAFLDLNPANPRDKVVLNALRAPRFIVPRNEDYAKVRDAVLLEGLLTHPAGRTE
jgi:phosphonate transport system substrate-binding protein